METDIAAAETRRLWELQICFTIDKDGHRVTVESKLIKDSCHAPLVCFWLHKNCYNFSLMVLPEECFFEQYSVFRDKLWGIQLSERFRVSQCRLCNAHSERDAADLQQRADLMKLLIITGCMLQKNSKVQHQHHCIPTEMKLQMHKTQINTHKLWIQEG